MRTDASPITCPECTTTDRRAFLAAAGTGAALALTPAALLRAADAPARVEKAVKPAEALVRELYEGLSDEQKRELVLPWDHGATGNGGGTPTRLRMFNSPALGKRMGTVYTKAQRELNERILRAVCSDEEGYRRISRNGSFDTAGGFDGCGAVIFGEPGDGKRFAWVFSGHHLTIRCDGNSEPGAGFGGPMFYGHSAPGQSDKNVFNYQTRSVEAVFDALDAKQRAKAVVTGEPGEGAASVKFRPADEARPGLGFADLSAEQLAVVEKVMRDVLSPYRKEDADEVMEIVKTNGGLGKLHLAFYRDADTDDKKPWHFWRLEGPGFVWNYRVLPHVHAYVNVAAKA
jgi:hypothetical protein